MGRRNVVINHAGFRKLLLSSQMQSEMKRRADEIAERANSNAIEQGAEYMSGAVPGRNRAHGGVVTSNAQAMRDQSSHNTLMKSVM